MTGETKFAQRIKKLRKSLALSLEDLSGRTGLDMAYLEALEQGKVSPSLGPLLKVARGLGTRLGTLIDDEYGSDVCVTRRASMIHDKAVGQARSKRSALRFHSLGAAKIDRHMEPFFIEIDPKTRRRTPPCPRTRARSSSWWSRAGFWSFSARSATSFPPATASISIPSCPTT